MNKGIVYILKDVEGRSYVGSTDNLDRRLVQHSGGHTATTNKMRNFRVVLVQQYASLKEARAVERKIKNLKRSDYIEKMIKEGYIRLSP